MPSLPGSKSPCPSWEPLSERFGSKIYLISFNLIGPQKLFSISVSPGGCGILMQAGLLVAAHYGRSWVARQGRPPIVLHLKKKKRREELM